MLIYYFIDGYTQICDVSMLAFLLQLLVYSFYGILLQSHLWCYILAVEVFPKLQQRGGKRTV